MKLEPGRLVAALAVAVLMSAATRASAETVSLDFTKTTASAPVGVTYTIGGSTTSTSITPGPYYWQQTGSLLALREADVFAHHFGDELTEFDLRLPAELLARLGRVA